MIGSSKAPRSSLEVNPANPCVPVGQTGAVIEVSGVIQIDLARRAEALVLIEPLMTATSLEEGCISYEFFEDPFLPGRFRIFEEWTDSGALNRHLQTPHVATFREGLTALGEVQADVKRYEVSHVGPNR